MKSKTIRKKKNFHSLDVRITFNHQQKVNWIIPKDKILSNYIILVVTAKK